MKRRAGDYNTSTSLQWQGFKIAAYLYSGHPWGRLGNDQLCTLVAQFPLQADIILGSQSATQGWLKGSSLPQHPGTVAWVLESHCWIRKIWLCCLFLQERRRKLHLLYYNGLDLGLQSQIEREGSGCFPILTGEALRLSFYRSALLWYQQK